METVEIPAGDAGTATLEASGEDGDRLSLMVLDEAFAAVTENVEVNLES